MKLLLLGLFPFFVLLLSCNDAPKSEEDLAAAIEAIQRHNVAFEQALSNSDIEALMAEIDDNAVWMPPDEVPLAGKDAIRSFYEGIFSQVDFEGKLDPNNQELRVFGDWAVFRAVLVGSATPSGGGEAIPIANKLVNLLRREPDGTWKHVWDIWNAMPGPPSKP
jgi:uncharacterized protein (TIGR02246 family)